MVDVGAEIEDRLHRAAVDLPRRFVAAIVREIGADHEERLRSAPKPIDHLGDLFRARGADDQRQQLELAQHLLQERQLHLERVLARVRPREAHHLRQVGNRAHRLLVDRDAAERRLERRGPRQREAAHRDAVARPHQHDPLHDPGGRAQKRECVRRDLAGVDVAGVRHDQRLRKPGRKGRIAGLLEHPQDVPGELHLVLGVEEAGDGGGSNGAHAEVELPIIGKWSARRAPSIGGRRSSPTPLAAPAVLPGKCTPVAGDGRGGFPGVSGRAGSPARRPARPARGTYPRSRCLAPSLPVRGVSRRRPGPGSRVEPARPSPSLRRE